jgi:histidine triad (HIT) family protein
MGKAAPETCLVCMKHSGHSHVPGGAIYEDELLFLSHAPLWGEEKSHYLGHLFLEPKRHVAELSELSEEEAMALGLHASRAARALMQTEGVEHVYAFLIGDGVPHVHLHIIGRYPGAPRAYWGPSVDEWPEAPRGADEEIVRVAARIRTYLVEQYG